MKKAVLFLTLNLLVLAASFSQSKSEWRGPNRDGIYTETNLLKEWPENGPELIKEVTGFGKSYSSVVFANNKIYTTGTIDSTAYLYIMDKDGEILVQKELCQDWIKTFPGARCTPTIVDDKGYFVSGLGELICFKADNGSILWTKDLFKEYEAENIDHGFSEILLVDGEKLYCTPGGKKATVVALNKDTGAEMWKSKSNGEKSAYCSPIIIEIGGKKLLVTNTELSTICLDASNGEMLWSHKLRCKYKSHANSPIYKEGHLFIMDGFEAGSDMLKLSDDGSSFELMWRDTLLDETNGHAVWLKDEIYIAAESKKKFCAVDWKTGQIKYSTKTYAPGTVIYADGLLYCLSYMGHLGIIEPTGTEFIVKSQFRLPKEKDVHIAHPVIKDGKLYLRYMDRMWIYNIAKS